VFGSPGFLVRIEDIQLPHVLVKGMDVLLGQSLGIFPKLLGPFDDLVVYVGEIPDIGDVESSCAKIFHQHVENNGGPGMADMTEIIHRHPAHIHAHFALPQGDEVLFGARGGVVEFEGHRISPKSNGARHTVQGAR